MGMHGTLTGRFRCVKEVGAGALRHRVSLQKKVVPDAVDSTGAPQEVWNEVCEIRAGFDYRFGVEREQALKMHQEATASFLIRYRPELARLHNGMKPESIYRLGFSMDCESSPEQLWNIHAIRPHEGKRFWMWVDASEIK